MRTGIFCATVYLVVSVACTSDESPEVEQGAVEVEADSSPVALNDEGEWFVDRAADVGLTFVHFNGASGDFLYPELLPPGVGLFDYDNDGDVDILVTQLNQPARLYRNQTSEQEEPNHWLRIKVVGRQSNRDGIGTKIRLQSGNLSLAKEIHSSSSYLSGHDPRPIFGLGGRQTVDHLILHWPSGAISKLENLTVDRQVEIVEGFD